MVFTCVETSHFNRCVQVWIIAKRWKQKTSQLIPLKLTANPELLMDSNEEFFCKGPVNDVVSYWRLTNSSWKLTQCTSKKFCFVGAMASSTSFWLRHCLQDHCFDWKEMQPRYHRDILISGDSKEGLGGPWLLQIFGWLPFLGPPVFFLISRISSFGWRIGRSR